MTDNTFWTLPPNRTTSGSGARYDLTVLQPPFTMPPAELLPNDPEKATQFARSLSTVSAVLADLGPRTANNMLTLSTRADLDIVQTGVWGNVMAASDPAWGDDGNGMPLLYEAERLRERFPDARIVGRAEVHCGAEHTEDLVLLPDGTMFHACGWPGDEPFVVTGDPHAVAASLGITAAMLEDLDAFVDLDDEPNEIEWAAFAALALGDADPWRSPHLQTSSLCVRHTEAATRHMEGLYFGTG